MLFNLLKAVYPKFIDVISSPPCSPNTINPFSFIYRFFNSNTWNWYSFISTDSFIGINVSFRLKYIPSKFKSVLNLCGTISLSILNFTKDLKVKFSICFFTNCLHLRNLLFISHFFSLLDNEVGYTYFVVKLFCFLQFIFGTVHYLILYAQSQMLHVKTVPV